MTKKPHNICLFTATGAENLGDELITLCEIQKLQALFPEKRIILFSHDVTRTQRFLLAQNIPLKTLDIREYFPNFLRKHPLKNLRLLWDTLRCIGGADHVYIGGGGLLYSAHEEGRSPLRLWWMRALLIKFFRKPLTYLSLGISTPMETLNQYASGLFAGAHMSVRDIGSQDTLSGMGYDSILLPDPVFVYEPTFGQKNKTIGIALRKGFLSDEVLSALVRQLLAADYDVILLPHSLHPSDERSHDGYYLQAFLFPGVRVAQTIEQTLRAYATCHIVIAMRLHSMILAIVHEIPFVGISYAPKTTAVLEDMQWEYTCTPAADAAMIIQSVQTIEQKYFPLVRRLHTYRSSQKQAYNTLFGTFLG